MTAEHGSHRGLARGGAARSRAAVWQPGNLVQARWVARLSDQLGSLTAELVHAGAALAMDDPLALAMLSASCAVAEGALPEREPHPRVFDGLLHLIPRLPLGAAMLPDLIRWEAMLLADLGYGLDLGRCAVTGEEAGLAWVSPRTGRAVSDGGGGGVADAAAAAALVPRRRQRGRARRLARRAAAHRAFPVSRCVRPASSAPCRRRARCCTTAWRRWPRLVEQSAGSSPGE